MPLAIGLAAVGGRDIPQIFNTQTALQGAGKGTTVSEITMPTEDPSVASTFSGVNGISIPASCSTPDQAAAFINFFANDPGANLAFLSDNGVVTSATAQQALLSDTTGAVAAGIKQNITLWQNLTASGQVSQVEFPAGINSLMTEMTTDFEAVAFGQMTVDQAVDQFFTAAQSDLS